MLRDVYYKRGLCKGFGILGEGGFYIVDGGVLLREMVS